MEQLMSSGTQTDPVVVLSLAQAAVLGLISQNEVFGATIAPNGFYTGEPKESPPPQPEELEYGFTDQLIGANGDYLPEPEDGEGPNAEERRKPGPKGKGKRKREESSGSEGLDSEEALKVKGEGCAKTDCNQKPASPGTGDGMKMIDLCCFKSNPPHLVTPVTRHKHKQNGNCCPSCKDGKTRLEEEEEEENKDHSEPSEESQDSPVLPKIIRAFIHQTSVAYQLSLFHVDWGDSLLSWHQNQKL
ncbi:UNVERIFIED_CONTAM: hypothetical protein FKN15_010174 [Acipenser sinensis]